MPISRICEKVTHAVLNRRYVDEGWYMETKKKGKQLMNLLFPQWQGAGPSPELFHGAMELADALPEIPWTRIPVESGPAPETNPETRQHILGYGPVMRQLETALAVIRNKDPERILAVGGDCGIELPIVTFLNARFSGNLTVIWLDAHGDLNTPETSPSRLFHGMPLAAILGHGDADMLALCSPGLSPDQVILAGARELDPPESALIRHHGLDVLPVRTLANDAESLAAAARKKGRDTVYLHIDLDVMDPDTFPHVACPEAGGLSPDTLCALIDRITDNFTLAGMSLVEFDPKGPEAVNTIAPLLERFRAMV